MKSDNSLYFYQVSLSFNPNTKIKKTPKLLYTRTIRTQRFHSKNKFSSIKHFMDAAFFSPKSYDLCHVTFYAKKQSSFH